MQDEIPEEYEAQEEPEDQEELEEEEEESDAQKVPHGWKGSKEGYHKYQIQASYQEGYEDGKLEGLR